MHACLWGSNQNQSLAINLWSRLYSTSRPVAYKHSFISRAREPYVSWWLEVRAACEYILGGSNMFLYGGRG